MASSHHVQEKSFFVNTNGLGACHGPPLHIGLVHPSAITPMGNNNSEPDSSNLKKRPSKHITFSDTTTDAYEAPKEMPISRLGSQLAESSFGELMAQANIEQVRFLASSKSKMPPQDNNNFVQEDLVKFKLADGPLQQIRRNVPSEFRHNRVEFRGWNILQRLGSRNYSESYEMIDLSSRTDRNRA